MPTNSSSLPRRSMLFAACLVPALCLPSFAAKPGPPPDHWVGTWATADVERANRDMTFGAADTTLRQIVHVSMGGSMVRVELSNDFGTEPLKIGAVHIALSAGKGEVQLPTSSALTFGGIPTIEIPPGAHVVSDAAAMKLPAAGDLTISIFLPAQKISHLTVHGSAYSTQYMAPGNVVGEKMLPDGTKTATSFFFLKAVDVMAPAAAGSVVAFGDSITDGTASTPDSNQRWPDLLAKRLLADKKTAGLGVLNEGIGGNRVLHDNTGPSALARMDRDVFSLSGVKYLIILESINDIGHAYDAKKPYDVVTAEELIGGFKQMIDRAHMHGIKVYGATLTPYLNAGYSSPAGEVVRQTVNKWIRTGNAFDGVIDFEAATMDKATGAFIPADDRGDHLHPTDAGMHAMADSIDLKLFQDQ